MLDTAQALIRKAGRKSGLSDAEIEDLITPNQEHVFEVVVGENSYPAFRVQHNNDFGPYKGGIRFHKDVHLEEVRALATLMTLKTRAVGLPLGGGKGGVAVDPKTLSEEELEILSRAYTKALHPHIGPDKDVPAPDVNTDSRIIDWMTDEYALLSGDTSGAAFTGKSLANGGSLGREAATGRGGVMALGEFLKSLGKEHEPLTYAVQGFGNVGLFFAEVAKEMYPHWKLVAASDSQAAVVNPGGLDVSELIEYKNAKKSFADFGKNVTTNEVLLGTPVDILVLAALGDAVTEHNVESLQAQYVVELANGPINDAAADILDKKGVAVLPDIIANAGGVIVSYLEWVQNKKGETWEESDVNKRLLEYMTAAIATTLETQKKHNVSLKEAAFIVAIERLAEKRRT